MPEKEIIKPSTEQLVLQDLEAMHMLHSMAEGKVQTLGDWEFVFRIESDKNLMNSKKKRVAFARLFTAGYVTIQNVPYGTEVNTFLVKKVIPTPLGLEKLSQVSSFKPTSKI